MTLQQLSDVPLGFGGSLPEYIVLRTLQRLGKTDGVDFSYQSSLFGGRIERGGVVVDFLFHDPPDLAINVQGVFYHYEKGGDVIARDRESRAQLAGQGITLIFIDEDDVLRDPVRYVQAALNYQDLSRLGGR
jgi:hypothetical protein